MQYAHISHGRPGIRPGAAFALAAAFIAAALLGVLAVVAEAQALIVAASLVGCLFVMLDFRVGVVFLLVLLPLSATAVFPHTMAGITGLNPMNLLLLATLLSLLRHGVPEGGWARIAPRPLVWLYLVPVLLAGLLGSTKAGEIPPQFFAVADMVPFQGAAGYLRDFVLKPLTLVLFTLALGAAAARSRRPERFLIPLLLSIWVISALTAGYVYLSGADLSDLASSQERGFLSPLGLHANDLGRYYTCAYALTLFTAAATPRARLRTALIATTALVVVALVLTFSRAAFLGFALVTAAFLVSRRQLGVVLAGGALVAMLAWFAPGAIYERLALGWGQGLDAISAGRVDEIWLPLLPEVWHSPIWGHGLASTIWSEAVRSGRVEPVGHPHNAFLATLLDMGVVGLLLLGAYFAQVRKDLRRLAADPTLSPTLRGFFGGGAVALAVFLIQGFSGSTLSPAPEQFYLWCAIGMMYGLVGRPRLGAIPA